MSAKGQKVIDGMLALAGNQAKTILVELGEDIVPTWVMCGRDKQIHIIATPWGNNFEKELTRMAMKAFIRKHGVVAYSFVTEAWAATLTKDEYTNPAGVVAPSERADRREVVVACAAAVGEDTKFARWSIERNSEGRVTELVSTGEYTQDCESWLGRMLK